MAPLLDPGFDREAVRFDADGLVPVLVQAVDDGRVLMLAYADAEALDATLATGEVHFHSRSRGRLWRKGETSGNVLRLVALSIDCDGDALLAEVDAVGPTCHRGTRSCFDPAGAPAGRPQQGFAWFEELWATIERRRELRPAGSYTTSLLEGGVDVAGRKVVEEATELLIAAKDHAAAEASGLGGEQLSAARRALAGEAADLVYHALVLLAERQLPPSEVIEELRARAGDAGR
jgi:phosphoribosyl-AMP cyclohydrolase / phosphoribosyl-ATP pyrophosphohydrolase